MVQGFGALGQASIDYHLEMARRCLASSASERLDPLQCHEEVVEQPQHGSRIAAKIMHLRNLLATLTPVPATTETQCSVFDRFRASVETLWNERREYGARDCIDTQPRLAQQVHVLDPQISRRSLNISSPATSRHRRAGSSRI